MGGPSPDRRRIAIVGAGPAGLMAAEVAARGGARVTLYDRMPSVGRKFLLAGRGGLNITHSEPLDAFLPRYGGAAAHLEPFVHRWTPSDVSGWCADLGQPTFVGTSGRVFPAAFKTSPLLRAWLRRLGAAGVDLRLRHRWLGWDAAQRLCFDTPTGETTIEAEATILALGGASWPHLGADGAWAAMLAAEGIAVAPLRPSNCGFAVAWSTHFSDRFAGQPLKGIALAFEGHAIRGEAVVTRAGLEGGALYVLSAALREALSANGAATLHVALRPDMAPAVIAARWQARQPKQSVSTSLRKTLALSPVAVGLLREAQPFLSQPLASLEPAAFAAFINAVPIPLTAPMPLARAISTAGGVRFEALDGDLMLRQRPGTFVAGEMLDWEAPTGGYLLHACLATGSAAGQAALGWLGIGSASVDLRRESAPPFPP